MSGRPVCPTCLLRHSPRCPGIETRWPLGPLVALCAAEARRGSGRTEDIANALGVERVALARAAEYGLTDVQADRWAVRCGHHPASIWHNWADAALTPLDRDYLANGWRQAWEWNQTRTEPAEAAA